MILTQNIPDEVKIGKHKARLPIFGDAVGCFFAIISTFK